jgi:hypothetical protein
MSSILEVVDVRVMILKSYPAQLSISAIGKVGSTGWTNGKLEPRFYIDFPADGIQDFDFVATPPSGIVVFPICPISASELWPDPPLDQLKGVRVHSSTNSIVAMIEETASLSF